LKQLKIALFVALLFAIGWFVRATDWAAVGMALQQTGWKFLWLLIVTLLAAWCGAIGWQYCLGEAGTKVRFYDLFLIRHIGETVGLVNPTGMIGGEALKAAMLHTKGIDRSTVIASVVVSRVLTIITQLILFVVVALFIYYEQVGGYLREYWGWIVAGTILLMLIGQLLKKLRPQSGLSAWRWLPNRLLQQIIEVNDALRFALRRRADLGLASVFLTLHWLFGGLEFYLILVFLNCDVTLLDAIFVDMGVVFFKVAGTFVPGQIGVEEYGNKVMLEAIGVTGAAVWVTASILRRARQLFWIGFGLATYFIYYYKPNIGDTIRHS
jgi:glycosyltransferase 2 family protein